VLTRRRLLSGAVAVVGAVVAQAACSRTEKRATAVSSTPPVEMGRRGSVRVLEWDTGDPSSPRAAIVVPAWGGPDARYPVVMALHGRGESMKAPAEGAMGWPRDYALVGAFARVCAPPLSPEDLLGMVDPARLARENAELEARPFRGVIVACPYLPDLDPTSPTAIGAYGRFLTDVLLPRVRRETPALATPEATGIDGVSLGGVTALRVGLARPDVFGAVGGIQPAIREEQSGEWTDLARATLARRPATKLRLLTSHDDYFRQAILTTSDAWRSAGIPHEFADVPGPHDYDFNRGPGSIELLLWNDRALAHA
jgi:iron(III)-salmochelin esterase